MLPAQLHATPGLECLLSLTADIVDYIRVHKLTLDDKSLETKEAHEALKRGFDSLSQNSPDLMDEVVNIEKLSAPLIGYH